MPWIAIDRNQGAVFEGQHGYGNVVTPTPVTAPAVLIAPDELPPTLPPSHDLAHAQAIFREDSFNAVTLVRRGRLYSASQMRPQDWDVHDQRGRGTRSVYPFQPLHSLSKVQEIERRGGQPLLAIGTESGFTIWAIASMEGSSTGEFLLTLRGRETFGALPTLQMDAIPVPHRRLVQEAVAKFREDVHRAGPASVIDRARDLAAAALSGYLQDLGVSPPGRDLGDLIQKLNGLDAPRKKHVAASAAEILRIFHSRAKPSVQEVLVFRPLQEQDARLAIYCVGTLLCELGWAAWY
jgi:hypothetical protein